MLYSVFKHLLVGPPLRLLFRPDVEGLDHIPACGPAILAGNHPSFSDSAFLGVVARRKVVFLAKAEYFAGPGVKGFLVRQLMSGAGNIPVERGHGRAALASLDVAKRVLAAGQLFGIYPEGTRPPDGRLYRGKTGVARLALETGAPLIPVAMLNTYEIQPPGTVVPKIRQVRIRIGAPLDLAPYRGRPDRRAAERELTDELMRRLQGLSGQEYVPIYAQQAKDRAASAEG
ncbi:MAG: 1-acyl-sn-glycerol-3-phosphate acyltransferase [Actinomycetota bacterium]|nr:1-acyl-sn-glycerol-3-phosphate acyltransferase [Cryptosporangiaceae bacterium]MDQ1678096.1 1-acyl-sn-glycerol-3-phosphate acyltransferase [Actinomycetota bacterium]